MYGIDEDLAKSFDAKKFAEKQQTPWLPRVDFSGRLLVKRVNEGKSPKKGKYYEFIFEAQKSTAEQILPGARYCERYYPGVSEVSYEIFWRNVAPILMAMCGHTDVLTFVPAKELGEFVGESKAGRDLDLPVNVTRKLEPARPDKQTGKYNPNYLNADGTPRSFPRDTYSPVTAATV